MKLLKDPIRIVPFTSFLGAAAVLWDSWWHSVIGRDTFFIPPHDLLYLALLIGFLAVILQMFIEHKLHKKIDRRLLISLITSLFIFVSAPFDELWHKLFGIELLTSALAVWSPPHLITIISFIIGGFAISRLVSERYTNTPFLYLLQISSVFTISQFLLIPLEPIGLHHLLGFYGTFFIAFVSVFLLILFTQRVLFSGTATLTSLIHFSLLGISAFEKDILPEISAAVPPHPHPKAWTLFFALLVGGLLIDGLRKRVPNWMLGFLYGLATPLLLYTTTPYFIEKAFVYSNTQMIIAIISGTLGGFLGGLILSLPKYAKSN